MNTKLYTVKKIDGLTVYDNRAGDYYAFVDSYFIKVYVNSEGDWSYDIYDTVQYIMQGEDTDSLDGGTCTTTRKNAFGMALDQIKVFKIIFKN